MSLKIGSLFSGSGGFELAAAMCGIEAVWASEIEPYPIAVTRSRFPNMKHLGSVTDIRGDEIEPVDIITFGSPCQDLSVAGKRAGLKHTENGDDETTRSGLFMEAVRIIKEMRKATNGEYPRYAIWENVPGAFSSNKGLDFRVVLEELIRITEPTAVMPEVPKAGWPYADVYCGDGWSLAYRVLDAQYWGVPQRRRRIYLVADFRGQRAGKISFEREGLRGYFAQSGAEGEATAGDAESGIGTADREGKCVKAAGFKAGQSMAGGIGWQEECAATLSAQCSGTEPTVCYSVENHPADSRVNIDDSGKVQTLTSRMGTGGGNVPMVMEPVVFRKGTRPHSKDEAQKWEEADTANTMNTFDQGEARANELVVCIEGNGSRPSHKGEGYSESNTMYTLNTIERHAVAYGETYQKTTGPLMANSHPGSYTGQDAYNDMFVVGKERTICVADHVTPKIDEAGVAYTLNARDYKDPQAVVYETPVAIDRAFYNQGQNAQYDPQFYTDGTVPTLVAKGPGAVAVRYIVRRLTPTECARLQGFPDTWGHPDVKTELTDEEYAFWLNVRNAHAEINGKATKEYTREQMLTWYNKLHTDSSEYKLWGNGIALPCALYVMQGIAEVSNEN